MFVCEKCNGVAKPGEPQHKVITKKRDKVYPSRRFSASPYPLEETRVRHDPGGAGWEIVKELKVCGACAKMEESS